MATKIQIICTRPGMRRHGVEHPASATYDIGKWSEDELAAFRADPSFIVQEIDDSAVVTKGDDFDKAVAAKVEERVKAIQDQMQASYRKAVDDAVAEKLEAAVSAAMKDVDPALLEKVKSLGEENTKLKAELDEAKAAKASAKK